ncbi:MAG TPA: serine/threonine-protein kinase [Planctomycetota bacterium]|nr:serine/threonine-protein kinase [Planctomycetota bacterium]HRR79022.1 serine/threonine-protein kinase [Planctomycetota bacterium]HRT93837.1 serine/threonine-protein kinase [Planctomycetota bacterium]
MSGTGAIDVAWIRQQFPALSDVRLLGQGGQKLVFSGTHSVYGETVLKLISPRQDAEVTVREILAVTRVGSPRVPQILEHGKLATPIGGYVWLIERRIGGHTVRDMLRLGPLIPRRVLRLGLHVLEALVAAERVNIVHRDVKPDNIICDPAGDYWLIDFGIARHLDLQSLTATAAPFGKVTWGYSPPEQCRNMKPDIDSRADLFALGVTLFECATGSNPFRTGAADLLEVLRRVETMPLPRLALGLRAAGSFADLVLTLTQKRRDHRPGSAAEALEWLTEIHNAELQE